MRTALIAVLTALAGVLGATGASAQGFGIYIGPPPVYADDYVYDPPVYGYGPRVYGYRYWDDDVRIRRLPAGHCGRYRYWDGETCVDARDR